MDKYIKAFSVLTIIFSFLVIQATSAYADTVFTTEQSGVGYADSDRLQPGAEFLAFNVSQRNVYVATSTYTTLLAEPVGGGSSTAIYEGNYLNTVLSASGEQVYNATANDTVLTANDHITFNVDDNGGGAGAVYFQNNDVTMGSFEDAIMTIGNSTNYTGTLNIHNATNNNNTIQMSGASATIIAGATGQNGTLGVARTADGANVVALNGAGSSVIASGFSAYSGGTAGTGTGNRMIVDGTSARSVSSDTFSSAAVANNSVSIVADTDGSGANARGALGLTATTASLTVNTNAGTSHGLTINQTQTVLSGGTNSSSWTLADAAATLGVGTATTSETTAISVTGVANAGNTDTAIALGGARNLTTTITSAAGAGNTSNTITATTGNNLIQATAGSNTLTGANGAGNTSNQITATTGNNVITATDGTNTLNANAANQSNTISATGLNGTNNLNARTNNIGVTGLVGTATTTNIGTGALQSTTAIGNTNALTTISGYGGNSAYSVANNAASMTTVSSLGSGGGNTNGLNVSDTTASVTVRNVNDVANGLNVGGTSGTFFIENTTTGAMHGLDINQTRTVLSGGTNSTTLTLADNGATFADSGGGPAQVHGVAAGTADTDAVNVSQLKGIAKKSYQGIASVAALAAIPSPAADKNYCVGAGYGNYMGENAVALGMKAIVGKKRDICLSGGVGITDGNNAVANGGVSYSF